LERIQRTHLRRWWVNGIISNCVLFKLDLLIAEIGVNLRSSSIIRYEFEGSFRSTIAENIRVGFTTTIPKGFLLGFSSNLTGEYLTIQVSNSGK